MFIQKKDSDANLVLIFAKKDSKSLLKVLPALIVFKKDSTFKNEIKKIYKNINTHSIKASIE